MVFSKIDSFVPFYSFPPGAFSGFSAVRSVHTAAVLASASKSAKVNRLRAPVSKGRNFSKMHRQPSSLAAL